LTFRCDILLCFNICHVLIKEQVGDAFDMLFKPTNLFSGSSVSCIEEQINDVFESLLKVLNQ
jgi:hypothetical protein